MSDCCPMVGQDVTGFCQLMAIRNLNAPPPLRILTTEQMGWTSIFAEPNIFWLDSIFWWDARERSFKV